MSSAVTKTNKIPTALSLWDGDTTKFPRAFLFDNTGATLSGSPVDLAHVINGGYKDDSLAMPDVPYVVVIYVVFDNILHTIKSARHTNAIDIFSIHDMNQDLTNLENLINNLLNQARADAVVKAEEDQERVAQVVPPEEIKATAEPDDEVVFETESEDEVSSSTADDDEVNFKTED